MVSHGQKNRKKTNEQTNKKHQRGSWNAETEKTDSYHPPLPQVVTINKFQVLLGSITCLPSV